MMNKKGVEIAVDGLFAILFIILLLFIYWIFFVIPTAKLSLEEQNLNAVGSSNNDLLLINYLKTPVIINGESILMSDLIRLYLSNNIYKDNLEKESSKIFDKMFDNYRFKINDDILLEKIKDNNKLVYINSTSVIPEDSDIIIVKLEVGT